MEMEKRYMEIRKCIEKGLGQGKKDFIIYPFGCVGLEVKNILNKIYGIQEAFIIDSNLCRYNPAIKDVSFLEEIDCSKYALLLASENPKVFGTLRKNATAYFEENSIFEFEEMNKISRGGGGVKLK